MKYLRRNSKVHRDIGDARFYRELSFSTLYETIKN